MTVLLLLLAVALMVAIVTRQQENRPVVERVLVRARPARMTRRR